MEIRLNKFASIYQKSNKLLYIYTDKKTISLTDTFCIKLINKIIKKQIRQNNSSILIKKSNQNESLTFLLNENILIKATENNVGECLDLFSFFKNPNELLVEPTHKEALSITQFAHPKKIDWAPAGKSSSDRYSCRLFCDKKLSFSVLQKIVRDSYGITWQQKEVPFITHTPIASAGALNPLNILVVEKKTNNYDIYIFDKESNNLKKSREIQRSDFKKSLLPDLEIGCKDSAYYIIITGDIFLTCKKYGHRGLLYTISEAGALAHQLTEVARKHKIQSVQIGGYYDDALASLLPIDNNNVLISLIALGYEKQ
jgi:SagB-type dehydrogenase family enzyme